MIKNHLELILGIVTVVVFCVTAYRPLRKARKIEETGIETDAVVCRIEEQMDSDNTVFYVTYVRYKDQMGELRESPIAYTAYLKYEEGNKIRIRYIPGEYELVRAVENDL